jgi:hypothetical protein
MYGSGTEDVEAVFGRIMANAGKFLCGKIANQVVQEDLGAVYVPATALLGSLGRFTNIHIVSTAVCDGLREGKSLHDQQRFFIGLFQSNFSFLRFLTICAAAGRFS